MLRDWLRITNHLEVHEVKRDGLIKAGRACQKKCKLAIHLLHKGSIDEARLQLEGALVDARSGLETLASFPALRQGAYSSAMEDVGTESAVPVCNRLQDM